MSTLNNKESRIVKAVSLLCFIFGASQMILLGLIPKIAKVTDLSITSVIMIYGVSIFHFLFMTKKWARLFKKISPSSIYRIGLWGIFSSIALLLSAFIIDSAVSSLMLFIISRVVHATTSSSIIPFSQLIKMAHFGNTSEGVLDTSMFLNIGRLIGLLLGGFLAFNLNLSLIVLMAFIIIVALWRINSEKLIVNGSSETEERKEVSFSSLFLIPLSFTLLTSFYNTGITETISHLFLETSKQSAMIYWTLTAATLCIVLIQIIMKRLKLMNSIYTVSIGVLSLMASLIAFSAIVDTSSLIVFILLFSIGAAIIPIFYMALIYRNFANGLKEAVASEISFFQTLGNASGALLAGLIIKYQFENELLFIFFTLILGLSYFVFRQSKTTSKSVYSEVSHGQ